MNNLVTIKRKNVLTNSLIIADGTGVKHKNVKELIYTYEDKFKQLGTLAVLNGKSTGGRPEQYFKLNEPQATFILTLMRNSEIVVDFKLALTKEFYRMRSFILERQYAEWQQFRITGKQVRREETDIILGKLIPHAESRGSKNAGKLYMTYSKLVNATLGI
ncbi:Rha family transcriptional regulator [Clostridium sp. BNL1100]|uniref:Rha family transcriptional regulator n=1 Tax=Clostridium sp. BNL1100 TaxID=755731 RepID=UPI00024A78D8|nr:Rha family transcriptional regulator [Clostridium sp. BNL1100]AEY64843.1 Phage regulatory protein Rha (Phage_pRha) [Clostridium sp. BNL1100]